MQGWRQSRAACKESRGGWGEPVAEQGLIAAGFTAIWFQQDCNKYRGTSNLLELLSGFALSTPVARGLAFKSSEPSCSVTVLHFCTEMPHTFVTMQKEGSFPPNYHITLALQEPHLLHSC